MDIDSLVKAVVRILVPYLPLLINARNKVMEGTSKKIGEDMWNKAKDIWQKLQPKVKTKEAAQEAIVDVVNNSEDEDAQAALRLQLRKILQTDPKIATEIAQILQEEFVIDDDKNIQMFGRSYDNSTFKQIGKIESQGDITL